MEVSFRAVMGKAHERRRVHLEREQDDPPMPKFFEVLHMSGTPGCWIHIILSCAEFRRRMPQTLVIPFKYPASRF